MRLIHATLALAALALAPLPVRAQLVQPEFLYKLSSMTGVLPMQGVKVVHDPFHHETLVVGEGRVRIFNASGMEVFSFGEDPAIGGVTSAAPLEDGDFLLLSFRQGRPAVLRANFRGELKSVIELKGIPGMAPEDLGASVIGAAKDRIYLGSLGAMHVFVFDMQGNFVAHHDVGKMVGEMAGKDERAGPFRREDHGMRSMRVAPNGDVLFTVPTLFRAFVLSPDGSLEAFGMKGSAPGKFNVISSMDRDERGYYYVTDILKSAVMVYDSQFRFLKEFGYRGGRPGSLFSPVDVAAGGGKVFVSQYARKGVSVFAIKVGDAP